MQLNRYQVAFTIERNCNPLNHTQRGIVTHKIDCVTVLNREPVSTIHVSYIPAETAEKIIPTPITYKQAFSSFSIPYLNEIIENIKGPPKKKTVSTISELARYLHEKDGIHREEFKESTLKKNNHEELNKKLNFLIEKFNKKYGREFREFKHLRVDKPCIDFIKVYNQIYSNTTLDLIDLMVAWLNSNKLKLFIDMNNNLECKEEMRLKNRISFDRTSRIKSLSGSWTPREYLIPI